MNIGQRIKERRKELGMSAEMLGDILGKNRSTIYRYENGFIENMPLDVLEPIAKALRTTPAYLMGWDVDEIDCIAGIQNDANTYDDANEIELKELIVEFSQMKTPLNELEMLKNYASSSKKQTLEIYYNLYNLHLTDEELNDVFNYASFIKNKRK